jgi:hypothetical protein
MKKYFYSDGTNNFGPFTFEELKEKTINRETNVWFQDLGEWKKAGLVPELNELFALMPPPVGQYDNNSPVASPHKSNSTLLDIFVFSAIAYWFAVTLSSFLITRLVDNWYGGISMYMTIFFNIIFAVVPVAFAFSVRNKTLKIIAIILSALIALEIIYSNMSWLVREI